MLIWISIIFGLVIYACQQYIPKVFKPFSGYFNNLDVSIIISWGRPEWESQILYIKYYFYKKNIYILFVFLTLFFELSILDASQLFAWLVTYIIFALFDSHIKL